MAGTYALGAVSIKDYEGDTSVVSLYPTFMDPLDGQIDFGIGTQNLDELKDAIQTIIIGKVVRSQFSVLYPEADQTLPTNKEANNASKWLITYVDTVEYLDELNAVPNPGFNEPLKLTLPTANGALLVGNEKKLRLDTAGVIANFVAAFQANQRTKFNKGTVNGDGAAVRILSIERVGRNV